MILPPSRTNAEAHLYMDLRPCSCGETRFPRQSAVVALEDGDLAARYTGACPTCGQPREFVFRLPAEPAVAPAGDFRYGGDEPSHLLDPGEWLRVADGYARSVPAEVATGDAAQRARATLIRAVAALDEVLKFVPPGEDVVPAAAFTTEQGRDLHRREPGRFRRDRLAAVRAAYAGMLPQAV
ncbi:hypothetical protein [Micromonospora sp. NPDC049204]|uniref:hypothetical protein n=1 Tax=unclassified Micromonospora TaxID=2617518 RepID=UPI0034004497